MRYFKLGSLLAMVALSLSLAQPAQAYLFGYTNTKFTENRLNLTFMNGDTPGLQLSTSGWYNGAVMESGQGNYIVAQPNDAGLEALLLDYTGEAYRNFFVFDITGLSGSITEASLKIYGGTITSSGTYTLFDVTTDIGDLKNDPGAGLSGFNDLGNDNGIGKVYGSNIFTELDYATHPTGTSFYTIPLNQAFIEDFNFALGAPVEEGRKKEFAIGGAVGTSRTVPPNVPEPSTLLLLGLALVGLAAWRRKHAA